MAAVVVVVGVLAGCNGPGAEAAGTAAEMFEKLAPTDAASACDLLSGHTREALEKQAKQQCSDALGGADLPDPSDVRSVDVYGHDAKVVLGNDVLFLARFPEGWRVTAAGCKAGETEDEPYDCDVSGG